MSVTIEAGAFFPLALDCTWEIVGIYQHEAPRKVTCRIVGGLGYG